MADALYERIAAGRRALVAAGISPADAAIDADVLARHVLGWNVAKLLTHSRAPAPPEFDRQFGPLIARRARREPVAFITGHREFWGLDFQVTPATLVPRPETEFIVEEALRWIPASASRTVLDVGTGTGCLAVSIAHERPAVRVVATDISHAALVVARRNAAAHGVGSRAHFVCTDLTDGLSVTADVIVANPPYVPDQAAAELAADVVRYEPRSAIFAGPDGLILIRKLFATAPDRLAPGGVLIMEFGYGQEDSVRETAEGAGWRVERLLHDLLGIPRTIVLRRE